GGFVFSDMSGCCDVGAQCYGNNPDTPYGTVMIPPSAGRESERAVDILDDWGPIEDGLYRTYRLRPDEALVTFGTLPPKARYFSFQSYLGSRDQLPRPILGSLGPALNHLVMEEQRGGPIWGQPGAIVTTLDADVEADVRQALVAAGWPEEHIHADRITGSVVRPGLDAPSDTFFVATRLALFDDPEAGAAYLADPALRVLRLTPEVEREWTRPWPWPELPERGSGTPEPDALRAARDRVAQAILDTLEDRPTVAVPSFVYWAETLQCIATNICAGDIRDRYTSNSPQFVLAPGEAVISVGVNHERTGRASYSSATVQTSLEGRGIVSLSSPDMPGSARPWLPDDPLADDLFVWFVARDCSEWPQPCTELGTDCPELGANAQANVLYRAYLEPSTGAAPIAAEMIPEIAIKVGVAGP
ncbi:MAG: hypothetical protein AAF602_21405, partial [Myxococcota bacterium]